MMVRVRTHYERLGVAPHASHDEIRRAYRAQAQRHHPDANPTAGAGARATMAEINAAWEILGDPERRRAYDGAIGTTPRPEFWASTNGDGSDGNDDRDDDYLADLRAEERAAAARRSRPSDLLVAIPVLLFVVAAVTFAFGALSQNDGLRTASILLVPVTGASFVAAPLFMMMRSRDRDRR